MHSQKPSWRKARSSTGGGEALQRLALEHGVGREVVEGAGAQAEEATVDPVLGAGLLAEAEHAPVVAVELGDAEGQLGAHDGDRGERAVASWKAQQSREVDVGEAVGVGGAERGLARAAAPPAA